MTTMFGRRRAEEPKDEPLDMQFGTAFRQRPSLERATVMPPDKEARDRIDAKKSFLDHIELMAKEKTDKEQQLADMLDRLEAMMAFPMRQCPTYPHKGRISPLVAAALNREKEPQTNTKTIEALVQNHGHDVNETGGGHGMTAIFICALLGRADCLNVLGGLGADLNISDDHDRTPAWVSANGGNELCLSACRHFKADLGIPNCFGYTPVHRAALMGRTDCLQLLINSGCDLERPNNGGYTPVWSAAYHGHTDCLKLLIEAGCLTHLSCGPDKFTPLEIAEFHSDHACAKLLRAQAKRWYTRPTKEAQ
jgi:hypothetical protein